MSKKKKDRKNSKKKKNHDKKKSHKHRSESISSSSSTKSGSYRDTKSNISTKEKNIQFSNTDNQNKNWSLSQKSETLLFDPDMPEDKESSTTTFLWRKKIEKTGLNKLDPETFKELNRKRHEEAQRELEKLEKRKIERKRELEEREREREFLQRQKEAEYHKEWEKQEDSFHFQQVKLRSKTRIEEARAKPIDLLARYINEEEDDFVDMREPYTYLNGLTIRDLEDLLVDIKVYTDLEPNKNTEYWSDITIVTQDELKKLQKMDPNNREYGGDRREGINQTVIQDISSLFKGKNFEQLAILEENIKRKIEQESGIDIGYWESVLSQLVANKARARLREGHQVLLVNKLQRLKKQQGIVNPHLFPLLNHGSETLITDEEKKGKYKKEKILEKKEQTNDYKITENQADKIEDETCIDRETFCMENYEKGNYSPRLLSANDINVDTFIVSPEEDYKRLEFKRLQVLGTGSVKPDVEEEFEQKARETVNNIESTATSASSNLDDNEMANNFSNEIPLQNNYLWSDKYRPRKPRYYNRVHTGYDWNQYNKKHYDIDNPPPKTVQGYKFNIFYPDLIDKTKTPTYSITACEDNKDFAVLRFSAGPPYEDVAFKIVNREWDISYQHGFRNQFQNGIFQLWFHFRKWKYRR